MKLEKILALGVAEDVAKQIAELSDAELAAEAKKLTDKEAELAMAAEKISELTEFTKKFDGVDVEKLKAELDEANKKYDADVAALKLENALNAALADSGALDKDIVKGLLDKSIIKQENGKLMGVAEQLDKLKADKAFLFGGAQDEPTGMTAQLGIEPGKASGAGGFGFDFDGVRPKTV